MPKGPKGENRPADVIANAVKVMRIATGEVIDELADKNEHAVELGRLGGKAGGKARAAKLTKKQRSAIATNAANSRWKNSP